jgi:hypothetical protein
MLKWNTGWFRRGAPFVAKVIVKGAFLARLQNAGRLRRNTTAPKGGRGSNRRWMKVQWQINPPTGTVFSHWGKALLTKFKDAQEVVVWQDWNSGSSFPKSRSASSQIASAS